MTARGTATEVVPSGPDEVRERWLASLAPGDLVSVVRFDGSSLSTVLSVDTDDIKTGGSWVIRDGQPVLVGVMTWPRNGVSTHEEYGFRPRISPPGEEQLRIYKRSALLKRVEEALRTMSVAQLDATSEAFNVVVNNVAEGS